MEERTAIERRLSEELRRQLTPFEQQVIDAIGDMLAEEGRWGEMYLGINVEAEPIAERIVERIAERISSTPQAVAAAIARLVELGFIATEYEDPQGRRRYDGLCQTFKSWRAHSKWGERWQECLEGEVLRDWGKNSDFGGWVEGGFAGY